MPARAETADSWRGDRLVFRSQLVLGMLGLAAAAAAVGAGAGSVHRAARGAHEVVVAGAHFTYPAVNVAAVLLLALAGLGALVLVRIVRAASRQLRAHRGFIRGMPLLGPLPGHPGVSVIDEPGAHAFCAGYLRPRVYISRGALDLLAEEELLAVLSHENRHRATHDPLRFACGRVLSQALFFMPALRALRDRYEELAERRADDAAVRASAGDRAPLAGALLAFDAAAPPGAAGISNERIDSLLGEAPGWQVPSGLVVASLALLCGLVLLVWRASAAASAHATFNLPVLSSQPCVLALGLLPALVAVAAVPVYRRRTRA